MQEPAIKNAMAFIDGQNLFWRAKKEFGHRLPNYDPVRLHRAVCAELGWRATLTRFYTGVPDSRQSPMWASYWSNRVLAFKQSGVIATTRLLKYRNESVIGLDGEAVLEADGTPRTITTAHEKGIDVRLALDVVALARKRQFDIALIFSQDQDLQELVQEVAEISREQDRWMRIACAFPCASASSNRGIDKTDWFEMTAEFYNRCLDPTDYRPTPHLQEASPHSPVFGAMRRPHTTFRLVYPAIRMPQ
jgi:uncharacterized LabA/DUF88 family protein